MNIIYTYVYVHVYILKDFYGAVTPSEILKQNFWRFLLFLERWKGRTWHQRCHRTERRVWGGRPDGAYGSPGAAGGNRSSGTSRIGWEACMYSASFLVLLFSLLFTWYVHLQPPNNLMQGREFSEQFIRQVCTDVLRGKSQTEILMTFSNY